MAQEILSYDSRDIALAVALSEREIKLAHKVIHIRVPQGTTASVRFGASDRPSIPLQSGWQRFCFPQSPGTLFLTAAAGSPIRIFTAEEIVADFFSEGGSGSESQDAATRVDWVYDPGSLRANVQINQTVTREWYDRGLATTQPAVWGPAGALYQIYLTAPTAQVEPVNAAAAANFIAGTGGLSFSPILRETNLVAGFDEDWHTVHRLIFPLARNRQVTDNLDNQAGLIYHFGVSATNFIVNSPFFGLVGNGAGWAFGSRVAATGGLDEQTALIWPGSVNDWVLFEMRVTSATPTRACVIQLYANRSLLIERDFAVNAGTLPSYGGAGNYMTIIPGIVGGIGGALGITEEDRIVFRWCRYIMTRHQPL